ncbi:MAG: hypothetical protein ACTS6J_04935 [Burkholderiales bacterium]
MIEDGFSKSHVTRGNPSGECALFPGTTKAGRILEFHSYNGQDSDFHGKADSMNGLEATLIDLEVNGLVVGRKLKALFDANAPWETVRAYLDQCVYAVDEDDLDKPAGPGQNFSRK